MELRDSVKLLGSLNCDGSFVVDESRNWHLLYCRVRQRQTLIVGTKSQSDAPCKSVDRFLGTPASDVLNIERADFLT